MIAAFAVLALVAGAIGALVAEAAGGGWAAVAAELAKPVTRSIIRFTLWQATLSAALSVGLAVVLARALARRGRFLGRRLILRLSSVSLIIPTMVAVLGLVAVHGRHGWINQALATLGFARVDYLYGLNGILIAHVFFNLPLATRILLHALLTLPQHTWDLARLYGMNARQAFRWIEWPLLRGVIPGVAGIVFLLCFTSFAIVLTLGGGPKSTTLEVAIYQAIRFDFDLSKAVALALIQIVLCMALAAAFFAGGVSFPLRADDRPGADRTDADSVGSRIIDAVVIVAAAAFLLAPLIAVLTKALAPGGWGILLDRAFWDALRWTLLIALCAGALSCALALALSNAIVELRQRGRWRALSVEIIAALTLLAPPIALGAGLFLLLRRALAFGDAPSASPLSLGPVVVIALNALLALAFGVRILAPALAAQRERYRHLCAGLGVRGLNQWRFVLWPALRHPLAYALAVATTLSAGDMGVIALFGTDELRTLPLLMYRLIGAYRLEQAAVVAAALCALCFALFWAIERAGGDVADADANARRRA
ncbi:MAG: thiamine/thiamine pyrophosphate ABC transporter permease [bacterium]